MSGSLWGKSFVSVFRQEKSNLIGVAIWTEVLSLEGYLFSEGSTTVGFYCLIQPEEGDICLRNVVSFIII
jgi:hypothetical protein